MPSGRRLVALIVVLVLVVGAAGVAGAVVLQGRSADRQKLAAARAFAEAWRGGTLASLTFAASTGPDVAKTVAAQTAGLTTSAVDRPASVTVGPVRDVGEDTAATTLKVTWALGGDRRWSYDTSLSLRAVDGTWRPEWKPGTVHPALATGGFLKATRTPATRGDIVNTDGTVLVTQRSVVKVGIEPRRATDPAEVVSQVAALVDVDGAALLKRVRAAAPTSFVDVITLREEAYAPLRSRLQAVPGTVFIRTQLSLAPTADFARALLGTVGPATKEVVDASGGRVLAGDVTGVSGVQRTYDASLAGTAGVTVTVSSPAGAASTSTPSPSASASAAAGDTATPRTLYEQKPVDGADLQLTLQKPVQEAADAAIAEAPKPAGMVAIRVSTGEVLAVSNGGPNAAGYDRALLGRYPPGSTFKVASGLALLEHGLTPGVPVACPATIVVNGKTFKNAEDEVLGSVPFSSDFAHSCNTAFVGSAPRITGAQLQAAASSLGYGQANSLGVQAFTGSVPLTDDAVSHAASMIGQDKVLGSPLAVAVASASAAKGERVTPKLVVAPAGAEATASATAGSTDDSTNDSTEATSSASTASAAPTTEAPTTAAPIPTEAADALRALMREVVTSGTGTALKNVPGGPVSGKTGTAQYGSDVPLRDHAWFTGFQGDIAFAVVVEDGGFGAETAAPIAADFLTRLS